MNEKTSLKIGLNVFAGEVASDNNRFIQTSVKDGKAITDYFVCHFDSDSSPVEESCKQASEVAEKFKELGADFISNFEFQNFKLDTKAPDGYDWANRDDETHLLNVPDEYIKALASKDNYIGLMYDELEHVIVNRNCSIELATKGRKKLNAFPLSKVNESVVQGELLSSQLKEYADDIKNKGAEKICGEHVFPVLFHTFARNGITPNFKSQKESYSNVQFAIAAGAACQYNTELFNCVDMWYRLTNPGHTADEMYHNLLFAYLSGVNRVYVESCHAMMDGDKLNDIGKNFQKFCAEYKGNNRTYDIQNYRPEIGIIRYDDTYWGQCDYIIWKRMLYGNKHIKPDYKSREYTKALNIITHGETCPNGISWGRISPWSLRKHKSFASMNSAIVFDDRVTKEKLKSLKLCFLCGCRISAETLKSVEELVAENGLVVVTTKRFVPDKFKNQISGSYNEISDGKGKWIVINSFRNKKMKKAINSFLGKKGEIRLTFTDREIILNISENGESFSRKENMLND